MLVDVFDQKRHNIQHIFRQTIPPYRIVSNRSKADAVAQNILRRESQPADL